jgi:hypothetical protein
MTKYDHSLAANLHLLPVTPNVLPELNANHPHQSMNSPTRALVGLPMGGVPLISQRPNRGPSMIEATKAVKRVSIKLVAIQIIRDTLNGAFPSMSPSNT